MGLLVDGKWQDQWYDTSKTGGKFEREAARFRNWVTADGSPGPAGEGGFSAEPGRYHLYVSMACPWAHRTLIFRELKGLGKHISVSVVHPDMLENGWEFRPNDESHQDTANGKRFMYEVYLKAAPDYSGRVTVPTLWDKQRQTIVSNESADIIRMFNSAFDGLDGVRSDLDFHPEELHGEIDEVNERVYHTVNNGVYKAGFATAQDKYEEAYGALFESLDWLEDRLSGQRYLAGNRLTEADWRLFTIRCCVLQSLQVQSPENCGLSGALQVPAGSVSSARRGGYSGYSADQAALLRQSAHGQSDADCAGGAKAGFHIGPQPRSVGA